MSTSSRDTTKRKRAVQPGTPIMVRLQPDQLARLDTWISEREEKLTRPEAVRRLIDYAMEDFGIEGAGPDPTNFRPASEVHGPEVAKALIRKRD